MNSRGSSPLWVLAPLSPDLEEEKERLSVTFQIRPLVAQILLQRGLRDEKEIRRFLHGTLADLPDPFLLPDMDKAVERLLLACDRKEKILFFGDYDVDGITGTAQMQAFFREIGREMGLKTEALLPHRMEDGYGLTEASVKKIEALKPDLLVTIDNGTKSFRELGYLRERSIESIVIDHHETPSEDSWPPVVALINPKREDSKFSERELASAGLVFLLLMAFRSRWRERNAGKPAPNLKRYLDLACLGTIADVVPLQGTNRILVKYGLEELGRTSRPGLKALLDASAVSPPVNTGHVGFRIAPRINAAGRLAHPKLALDLLLCEEMTRASLLAADLETLNRQRQEIEEKVLKEACLQVEDNQMNRKGLVVASRGWHLGVVGIVAARLTELYQKPAVVLAISEEGFEARGSARTVPGFSVYEALKQIEGEMLRFGGHAAAAGMTVRCDQLESFSKNFDRAVCGLWKDEFVPAFHIDASLKLSEINSILIRELSCLEPHGSGNPEPSFLATSVRLESSRVVGKGPKNHLKTVVNQSGMRMEGICFGRGDYLETANRTHGMYRLAYLPQINEWNGVQNVQLKIKRIEEEEAP